MGFDTTSPLSFLQTKLYTPLSVTDAFFNSNLTTYSPWNEDNDKACRYVQIIGQRDFYRIIFFFYHYILDAFDLRLSCNVVSDHCVVFFPRALGFKNGLDATLNDNVFSSCYRDNTWDFFNHRYNCADTTKIDVSTRDCHTTDGPVRYDLLSILSVKFAFSSPFPFFILHLYNPVSSFPGFYRRENKSC